MNLDLTRDLTHPEAVAKATGRTPNVDNVTCPSCKRIQRDAGERATCGRCGFSPLPSRAYPPGHVFRPRPNR